MTSMERLRERLLSEVRDAHIAGYMSGQASAVQHEYESRRAHAEGGAIAYVDARADRLLALIDQALGARQGLPKLKLTEDNVWAFDQAPHQTGVNGVQDLCDDWNTMFAHLSSPPDTALREVAKELDAIKRSRADMARQLQYLLNHSNARALLSDGFIEDTKEIFRDAGLAL